MSVETGMIKAKKQPIHRIRLRLAHNEDESRERDRVVHWACWKWRDAFGGKYDGPPDANGCQTGMPGAIEVVISSDVGENIELLASIEWWPSAWCGQPAEFIATALGVPAPKPEHELDPFVNYADPDQIIAWGAVAIADMVERYARSYQ